MSSAELVAHVGDQRQLLLVDQLGDALDQARLLHLVGNFRDDDEICAAAGVFRAPARAHAERAAPGCVGLGDLVARIDDQAAGREIRSGHELEQCLRACVRVVDEKQRGIAQLRDIVRRNGCRHAHRDALRAVGEQVRERRRQHHRLFRLAVVVRPEVDRVVVDAIEQKPRNLGHARFRITVGGRVIAVDVAEIALPVDQRVARREILRQPHQRVVDRLIAVRMEITHHVTDDLGRLLERGAGLQPQQTHAVEDAAVHRLHTVARVGQRAVHDGGERIGEIALLERLAQGDLLHLPSTDRHRRSIRRHRRGGLIRLCANPLRPHHVRRSRKPKRRLRRIVLTLFAVLVLALVGMVGTAYWIDTKLHRIPALADYPDRPAAGQGHDLAARRVRQPARPDSRTAGRVGHRWRYRQRPHRHDPAGHVPGLGSSTPTTFASIPRDSYVADPRLRHRQDQRLLRARRRPAACTDRRAGDGHPAPLRRDRIRRLRRACRRGRRSDDVST